MAKKPPSSAPQDASGNKGSWPPPLGDPAWFKEEQRLAFLDELASNGGDAVNALLTKCPKVSVLVLHNTLKTDAVFRASYENSITASTLVLRSAVVDRGVRGIPTVEYGKDANGEDVVTAKSFDPSDKLLEAELKAREPKLYSEKARVELTGKDGGPIEAKSGVIDAILGLMERAARPRVAAPAKPVPKPQTGPARKK